MSGIYINGVEALTQWVAISPLGYLRATIIKDTLYTPDYDNHVSLVSVPEEAFGPIATVVNGQVIVNDFRHNFALEFENATGTYSGCLVYMHNPSDVIENSRLIAFIDDGGFPITPTGQLVQLFFPNSAILKALNEA